MRECADYTRAPHPLPNWMMGRPREHMEELEQQAQISSVGPPPWNKMWPSEYLCLRIIRLLDCHLWRELSVTRGQRERKHFSRATLRAGDVTQVVEHLPSKHRPKVQTSVLTKKKKKKERVACHQLAGGPFPSAIVFLCLSSISCSWKLLNGSE
jgi:hypothetical protein